MIAARPKAQPARLFTEEEHTTWQTILNSHTQARKSKVIDLFDRGVNELEIKLDQIPSLTEINAKLKARTGWQGVFVEGLEEGTTFYAMLAQRQFPIGNFIRSKEDISYTPAPDVVHDLYGHLPFLTNSDYADFCQRFGELACKFSDREDLLRQFERFFWFTIEFGLVETAEGRKVFGAGIASSTGECEYALSDGPVTVPFAVDSIRKQEFRIDVMQPKLFVLTNTQQLYDSLDELFRKVESDR